MGLFKKIGKAFKKVAKFALKVAPYVLLAGAAIFTGGAALGLPAFAGGWGAAAASFTQTLGLSGTLGSVVTGAVTNAGYGALLGAGGAALTGQSITKGAQLGAAAGAVGGGISGFAAAPVPPAGDLSGGVPMAASPNTGTGFSFDTARSVIDAPAAGAGTTPAAGAAPTAVTGNPAAAGAATATPGSAPGVASPGTGFGSFLKDNQTLLGNAIAGFGQAYLEGKAEEDRIDRYRENYDVDPSVYTQPVGEGPDRPTPREAYGDRRRSKKRRRWVYDRNSNEIVRP